MNKDSKTLTKIFNMADELGLYCSMVKARGEVLSVFVGGETFFRSDCIYCFIHSAGGHKYTYRDLKKHLCKCKELGE